MTTFCAANLTQFSLMMTGTDAGSGSVHFSYLAAKYHNLKNLCRHSGATFDFEGDLKTQKNRHRAADDFC